jgi:glucose-6-phosphate isomerase
MEASVGSRILFDWEAGRLSGAATEASSKTLGEIAFLFRDASAAARLDPETVVYRVECWLPVASGTSGGLFWGITTIAPGKVGDEYFMTHGHFHQKADSAEFYAGLSGEGMLLLMDRTGRTWSEPMARGSLHYIPGVVAHRVVNTGAVPLVFAACWPSDAGHDYTAIRNHGFGIRVREREGRPVPVAEVRGESARD